MAEYSANAVQTVQPGQAVVFTTITTPCNRGLVIPRLDAGSFLLRGWIPNFMTRSSKCCCNNVNYADYFVDFGANIAVPDGQTAGPISLTLTQNGSPITGSAMIVTPTVADAYFNVSRAISVLVPTGCCQSVTVQNTSTIPILVQNANIVISRPDLAMSY